MQTSDLSYAIVAGCPRPPGLSESPVPYGCRTQSFRFLSANTGCFVDMFADHSPHRRIEPTGYCVVLENASIR
jgi:hypothetical protein